METRNFGNCHEEEEEEEAGEESGKSSNAVQAKMVMEVSHTVAAIHRVGREPVQREKKLVSIQRKEKNVPPFSGRTQKGGLEPTVS